MKRIVTDYWQKPVPSNLCDWSATDSNYEAEVESDGHVRHSHPIGYGATEDAARADFLAQVEDPEAYVDAAPESEELACEECRRESCICDLVDPGSACTPGCGYCGRCT